MSLPIDPPIPEVCHPTSVCPNPRLWHCYEEMTTELEVLALLTALVIALKPNRIIETGCFKGSGTEALATGVAVNGFGRIDTCDISDEQVALTFERIAHLPEHTYNNIGIRRCTGLDLIRDYSAGLVDFAFLDSGMDIDRCDELRSLYPMLRNGGVVAIHDTGIHTYLRERHLPPLLRELDMQHLFFDTPRGLTLCRKKPEVYP